MIGGITGKILRVDLSKATCAEETYQQEYLRKYVGGDGLAARILYDEVHPGVSALDPENRLVISAGPLAGTRVQAACNISVASKSPVTGFTIYNSHSNGFFAPMLKFSGYDAIIVQGKAEALVYLWIHDGQSEIRDAGQLRGKDTSEVPAILKAELREPKLRCMVVGPAGENGVVMASIVNDNCHVNARGGLGMVMGSKNLKAIVVYGRQKLRIADESRFRKLSYLWRTKNMESPTIQRWSRYGTAGDVGFIYQMGDYPIKNWSTGVLEGCERLSGQYMVDNMLKRHTSCWGCSIAHSKLIELRYGAFAGIECEMPEYEITSAWGANIGVTDPTVVAKANDMCDKYGLDGLGTSNAISFAMECYEKGLITKEDTGGIDLRFGNFEAALQMIDMIAQRQGFGGILAKGTASAAAYIGGGSEKFAVLIKNMPIPMHDYRAAWGAALQYAVGSAGPAHEGSPLQAELSGALPRFSIQGKAKVVKQGQERRCFINTLGVCNFGTINVPMEVITGSVTAATGLTFTPEDACQIAMRIVNLRRAFSIRHGLVPEDDTLPYRLLEAPREGGAKGSRINLKPMVDEYYDIMGWDRKTGKPYRRTLEELDLKDVAKDMWG
jgi:aldehyde:ferredoxin oxidoreductase